MNKTKIGVIGCGNISDTYFRNCPKFENLEVAACADLMVERAREKAKEFNIPKGCSVEELLADEDIRIVINLTIPIAHTEVNLKILNAGKNVYVEKPLGISRIEARKALDKAAKKRLFVGCAPDTFMGAGIQACKKIIDEGGIGEIVGATAFMMCPGHESWHPAPEFYYKKGGGPMFDMGPYYLTALVNLIGSVRYVSGAARISSKERLITSKPKYGTKIKVEVPTHVAGIIEFSGGPIGTIITSFDVLTHQMPYIEIYGKKGTVRVTDPNDFGGVPLIKTSKEGEWKKIPLIHGFSEDSRGVGVSDMADAIANKRLFRTEAKLAFHVLDIMQSIHESAKNGKRIKLGSACRRPEPMPVIKPEQEAGWVRVKL